MAPSGCVSELIIARSPPELRSIFRPPPSVLRPSKLLKQLENVRFTTADRLTDRTQKLIILLAELGKFTIGTALNPPSMLGILLG